MRLQTGNRNFLCILIAIAAGMLASAAHASVVHGTTTAAAAEAGRVDDFD